MTKKEQKIYTLIGQTVSIACFACIWVGMFLIGFMK